MEKASVLLYNFKDEIRLRTIRRYLNKQKIQTRIIQTPEFLQPLGFLLEIPGFAPNKQFNLGRNFHEEMLVMKDFSDQQMEEFFGFFKENDVKPVDLKAVITPVNQHWNSIQLYEELVKEREFYTNQTVH